MVTEHDAQSGQKGIVILQRLAHTHHHHIGDHSFGCGARGLELSTQKVLGKPKLEQNFTGGEVAAETLVTRGAKAAPHGTARLRGHT